MADKNNPFDDDLIKELGLEPAPTSSTSGSSKSKKEDPFDFLDEGDDESASAASTMAAASAMDEPALPAPKTKKSSKTAAPTAEAEPAPAPAKAPAAPQASAPKSKPSQNSLSPLQKNMIEEAQALTIPLTAIIGKKSFSLKEILQFEEGQVIDLNRLPQDSIDLVANGKLVARGELVLIDGKVGVQIKQIKS